VGYERTATAHLSHPLGERVLIDAVSGAVVPVYPPGTPLRLVMP
jgi:hypothetical protein